MTLSPYKKSTEAVFLRSDGGGMDYDRRRQAALPRLNEVMHKPGAADDALATAYLALVSFKLGMDSMEEIPHQLHGIYDQVNKAIGEVIEAKRHTGQLREMAKRLPR